MINIPRNTPEYYKTVFGSPIMYIMPYAWVDLIESDYIDEFCRPFEYDEEAFAILDDEDNVIAFITFKDYDTVDFSNVIEVGIGYVLPGHRKKGLYEKLYARLRFEAVKRKKKFIWSSVWANNKVMLKHAKAQGREVRYIGISERII